MDIEQISADGIPLNIADTQARTDITEIKSNLTDYEKIVMSGDNYVVTNSGNIVTLKAMYRATATVAAFTWIIHEINQLETKYKPIAYSSDITIPTSVADIRLRQTTALYIENTTQLTAGLYSIMVSWIMRGE